MTPSLASKIRAANAALLVEGDLDAIGDHFAPDYVAHGTGKDLKGAGAIRTFLRALRAGFPELEVGVEILVEGKDRVAWQRSLRGKQTGDFMGFPATGRRVVWRDMVTSRFRGGRIAEDWVITDQYEQLTLSRERKR